MKKFLCLLLIISMMIPAGITVSAAEVSWGNILDTAMPFRPEHNYVSQNNPPSFSWPLVSDTALYELRICTDKEMQNVAFEKIGIPSNVYNFNVLFETETKYYWAVRFKEGSNYSTWSETREFMIDAGAVDFRMEEFTQEYINSLIDYDKHPRLILNDDILAQLRSLKGKNTKLMETLKNKTELAMAKDFPSKEEVKAMFDADADGMNGSNYWAYAMDVANVSLMYLVTQDKKYLNFVEEKLIHMQTWVPKELFVFNSLSDTTSPYFINAIAYVYDWLYNDMSEEARKAGKKLIENHIVRWYEYYGGGKTRANMNSLYAKPAASHQWRGRQISLGALAIYEDSQVARDIIANILPLYVNALPMTGDDGSFENNPFYSTSSATQDAEFADALYTATNGVINVRKNVAFQNRDFYLTYQWPVGGFISILGDQNRQTSVTANMYIPTIQAIVAADSYNSIQRGINAWMMKKSGKDKDDYYHTDSIVTAIRNNNADVEYIAPTMLQKAKLFKDAGIASLFSDVTDDNKIAMIFRSSDHGSLGHMHPDNNSFFIQALGENLVIDSDYYDAYLSDFDLNWNRKSYAHNTITYDIGTGQPYDDKSAQGHITDFINFSDFDLVSGDATKAYKGGISKFQRDIIYLRPDTFIVIDDLAARADKESEFEWWINSSGQISLYNEGNGLQAVKNEAALDLMVAYPDNVTAYYNNEFQGPDGSSAGPLKNNAATNFENRVYFKTEKTAATKMVTTMNIHKVKDGQAYIKETTIDNIVKLEFEDGTVVYVKTDDAESVTIDGFTFSGRALAVKGNRYMVVRETNLTKDGMLLFEADVPTSCAFGNNEVSLSSQDNEAKAKVYLPGVTALTLIRDEERLPLTVGEQKYTIKPEIDGDYVIFDMYYNSYNIYLNDKPLPGAETIVNFSVIVDGVTTVYPVKGYLNGNQVYAEWAGPTSGKHNYLVVDSYGISGKLINKDRLLAVSEETPLVINKENASITLRTIKTSPVQFVSDDNNNILEKDLASSVPAIKYSEVIGVPFTKFWTNTQDGAPHNDTTLQSLNNINDIVTWTLEVPESGYYDLVMSCSTLSGLTAHRLISVGDLAFDATFQTDIFNDLDSYRFDTNVYLEKGETKATLYVTGSGSMIFDWVGLIPADK